MYRAYWKFYWPLALTAVLLIIELQVFNGILARYPNAERELAVFAYALSTFLLLEIGTVFMPQLVTVFARSKCARKRVGCFCLLIGVFFSTLIFLLGSSLTGQQVLNAVYHIDGLMLQDVAKYLTYLAPIILVRSGYNYFTGLLIQDQRTTWVTISAGVSLLTSSSIALYGFYQGWSAFNTIVIAQITSRCVSTLLVAVACGCLYRPIQEEGFEEPSYRDLFHFFWPVTLSGLTFGISRPIIYAFVSYTDDAILTTAALRVSLDFFMLFQITINQFRNFIPSFGMDNLAEKRKFMVLVTVLLTLVLAIIVLTPMNKILFQDMLGLNDELFVIAAHISAVFLVVPAILNWRNYYHGILLIHKKTQPLGLGSGLRVVALVGGYWGLLTLGLLDYTTVPWVMVFGFFIEAIVAVMAVRYGRAWLLK